MKRCSECHMEFRQPQEYRYLNGWKQRPICRNRSFCVARKDHAFRVCHLYTPDGEFVRCGFVRCGYADHRARAVLS